jgi:hypothetical protein
MRHVFRNESKAVVKSVVKNLFCQGLPRLLNAAILLEKHQEGIEKDKTSL